MRPFEFGHVGRSSFSMGDTIMKIARLVLATVLLSPAPTMAQVLLCGVDGCNESSRVICGVNPCDFHLQRNEDRFLEQMRRDQERRRFEQEADAQRYRDEMRRHEEQRRFEQEKQQMLNEQQQRLWEEKRRSGGSFGSSFDSPFGSPFDPFSR
jgi:hypothetical protein